MAFWHKRQVIKSLAIREIRSQYVGSMLGLVWQFITPLILILVFWVVFSVGLRMQPASGVPFVVWLTAGLSAWFAFSEIVSGSVGCITGNPHLVKKVLFPTQVLPGVKILTALSNHLLFLLILMGLIAFQGLPFSWWFLQFIYYFICMVVLSLGVGWLVAAFNVYTRDTQRLVGVVLQVGMWATPILWELKIMPPAYAKIMAINPMNYIVQGYRDSFINFIPVTSRPDETMIFWVITCIIFTLGCFVFLRLKPQFADLV